MSFTVKRPRKSYIKVDLDEIEKLNADEPIEMEEEDIDFEDEEGGFASYFGPATSTFSLHFFLKTKLKFLFWPFFDRFIQNRRHLHTTANQTVLLE